MPIKLGELLVKENLITPQQLQEALQYQKQNGGKLGYNLVKLGFVKDEEITQLLSRQYGVPSINLARFEIDPSVIKLVPAETAQKYQISDQAMEMLKAYDWPGNVRELENVIERAMALEISNVILPERLIDRIRDFGSTSIASKATAESRSIPADGIDFSEEVANLERDLLTSAMTQAGGVQTKAARLLHMNLRSFRYLLQKYDLR